MDESRPKPLADDPTFLAGLDDLDRGLTDEPSTLPPQHQTPTAPAHDSLIVAPFPTRSAYDAPIVVPPGSRRPLLDLFPPAPTGSSPRLERTPRSQTSAKREPARAPRPAPRAEHTFYGFSEPPFALEPEVRFLFRSIEHDRAAREILAAISRSDRTVVVTAPTGMGKTLLCRSVAEQLGRRTVWSIVERPAATYDELVEKLLVDFGVLSRDQLARAAGGGAQQRANTLRAFLASLAPLNANAVVFLDEAQNVAVPVLAAVHALAAEMPGTLQVVLAGQPSLMRVLAQPALRDITQPPTVRVRLGPLAADEVPGYVMHRIQIAAASPRIEFDDAAFEALYEASLGVPRIVNQLCDRALARAHRRSAPAIDAATLGDAARDLGIAAPSAARDAVRTVALGVAFVLLMGVGAGASAWVFRDRVHRILVHYGYVAPS